MDKRILREIIRKCHETGKKVAVSFCIQVPSEILEAAGLVHIRIPYVQGAGDSASRLLPANVCPAVKNCCDVCEDECLQEADLVLAETSCDGKRKMYELISRQERVCFYQVPQGADRGYVRPLIQSECRYLVKEIEKRFGTAIAQEDIRRAGKLLNQERESIAGLMEIQKQVPPAAWGREIFEVLESCREDVGIEARIAVNKEAKERFRLRESPVPLNAKRILVTGCPLSGTYEKILSAVEGNGGVAVCLETCEVMKAVVRRFDTENEDVYGALADCYQNTACAIMAPNTLRLELLERLVKDYRVEGILDVMLQTCHPYTVERDTVSRFCRDTLGVPYIAVSTDTSEADIGQLATRIAAFMEML